MEAPEALSVVGFPVQIVVAVADRLTVGVGLTFTVTVLAAPAHPVVVPVTVYVSVLAGLTVMLEPVCPVLHE